VTVSLNIQQISKQIQEKFPDSVIEADGEYLLLQNSSLEKVARYCHDAPDIKLDFLSSVTGVDYIDYFEVIYYLVSIEHNHRLILKTRLYDRDDPKVSSLTSIWQGAVLQEREVYDLMGISFIGHPDLKRIFLWEGFPGYPHRKDFTSG
jgi:NADH-quinone oxidoreductase subunit C